MLVVPDFARMNRVGPPREYPWGDEADHAPTSTPSIDSKVWI